MKILSRFDGRVLYRPIAGYVGYRVGNDGTVWTCKNNRWGVGDQWKRLKPYTGAHGYLYVTLCSGKGPRGKAHYVHRLVLEAFIGPCPDGMEACHYPDGDPGNCHVDNLRWDYHGENMKDSIAHGNTQRGSRQVTSKLVESDVIQIRSLIGVISSSVIATRFSVSRRAVNHIIRGSTWSWLKTGDKI